MQPQNNYGYGYGTTGGGGSWGQNQMYYNEMMTPTTPTPQPKKNNKMIIIAVVALVAVLGVIGILMLMSSSSSDEKDPVSNAVYGLLSESAPKCIAIDGKINFEGGSGNDLQNAELRLKSSFETATLANQTVVGLSASVYGHNDLSLKMTESYSGENDIFLKLDGIAVSLAGWSSADDSTSTSKTTTTSKDDDTSQYSERYLDCLRDVNNTTDCSELQEEENTENTGSVLGVQALLGGLEAMSDVDGKWIHLSTKTTGEMSGQCVVDAIDDWRNNRETLANLYAENPFIYSEILSPDEYGEYEFSSDLDEQVVTALKNGGQDEEEEDSYNEEESEEVAPVIYQVKVSDEVLTNFLSAAAETGALKMINSCGLGQMVAGEGQVVEVANKLPNIFVTIGDDGNLAQIYFAYTAQQNDTTTVGLELSYPESILIQTPKNYLDMNTLLQGSK